MSEKLSFMDMGDFIEKNGVPTSNLTLRDYFAAKAMEGFNKRMVDYGWSDDVLLGHAKEAYRIADAMLEARK